MKGGGSFDIVKRITINQYKLFMKSELGKTTDVTEQSQLTDLTEDCLFLLEFIFEKKDEYIHKLFLKTLTVDDIRKITGGMEYLQEFHCIEGGKFSIIDFMNSQQFMDPAFVYKKWNEGILDSTNPMTTKAVRTTAADAAADAKKPITTESAAAYDKA